MQALKATIAFIFLALVLSQSVNLTLIKTHWKLNQAFIANNLCVNRFNPDSGCKRKCILMQKLHEQASQEAEQKALNNPLLGFNFFCEKTSNPYSATYYISTIAKHLVRNEIIQPTPYLFKISKPPEA